MFERKTRQTVPSFDRHVSDHTQAEFQRRKQRTGPALQATNHYEATILSIAPVESLQTRDPSGMLSQALHQPVLISLGIKLAIIQLQPVHLNKMTITDSIFECNKAPSM